MKDQKDNKNIIISDLHALGTLLQQFNFISDAKPLFDAAGKLYNCSDECWEYECINIKFLEIEEKMAGAIPIDIVFFQIIFNINIKGLYTDEIKYSNPLIKLNFDIDIEGIDEKGNEIYSSLHLDKHISEEGDGENKFIHPEYHFTFGGNNLEARGDIFKGFLILPTPRIPHPPMDIFLGIDFIIQNYFTIDKRRKLVNDSQYREIMKRAQDRLWRPYFSSIYTSWHPLNEGINLDIDFTPLKILPFLC